MPQTSALESEHSANVPAAGPNAPTQQQNELKCKVEKNLHSSYLILIQLIFSEAYMQLGFGLLP